MSWLFNPFARKAPKRPHIPVRDGARYGNIPHAQRLVELGQVEFKAGWRQGYVSGLLVGVCAGTAVVMWLTV